MNPQYRVNEFLKELDDIQKKWGIVLVAHLQSELLNGLNGQQLQQTRPVIAPAALDNWQPMTADKQEAEKDG